jgi:hypothetical protein
VLVAPPLSDTFGTLRNIIDPRVQAIQAGAEMARSGLGKARWDAAR